ncbi:hypothetical protein GGI04_000134 [Coemansia thaxteri]|uniref:Cyclin N-terminal domain-containing protein n=1 Tax=Coemansia thaxteri TaxID=2663907 RepID=A0A9W8EGU0_9FUNG|nr:hypothetical protein H4R26_001215 [Coemansia thaxteri]KAJ2009818.1 hypothetical protein GGI04_000134 [Coemansia thaxteri]KAJ2474132.1 hypothetical protein GGI02_000343 [Coemansia sp. RSA 2322]KAJ2486199.1 hypothetical protein EV174_001263 [Coemansia sp. RSA 2320]
MDASTLSNEQLAYVAAKTFSKLWMARGTRDSSLLSFQAFCCELLRSTQIAVPIVMLTLLYVNKFKQKYPGLHGGYGSEYRMFVVALMLASKYLEDNTFTTQTWSEVSHLPAKDLTIMQREFLVALEHRLHVPSQEYTAWITQLQTIVLGGSNVSKHHGISLVSPALVPAPVYVAAPELCSPAEFQVVPSPSVAQYHEIPAMELLPSPPAKRMRPASSQYYSTGFGARSQMSRVCSAVEPLTLATHSAATAPGLYTPPPSSGVGFARGEFTFSAPSVPVVAQNGGMYYGAPPQSAAVAYHRYMPAATQSHPAVSSALLAPGDRMSLCGAVHSASEVDQVIGMVRSANAAQQQQHRTHIVHRQQQQYPAAPPSASFVHYAQQHAQLAAPHSAAAAAAALASQYPSLYYGAPGFGFGQGAVAFPIYTYGV